MEQHLGLLLTVGGYLAGLGVLYGVVKTKLDWLGDKIAAVHKELDGDLGRLNAKVENDIHGRRAVQEMQHRLTRLEVKEEMHHAAASKEAAA